MVISNNKKKCNLYVHNSNVRIVLTGLYVINFKWYLANGSSVRLVCSNSIVFRL